MIIIVKDIPRSGKEIILELDKDSINERVNQVRKAAQKKHASTILPPEYVFDVNPKAELLISLEGKDVIIKGDLHASFISPCSRCAEEIKTELSSKIDMVLKPIADPSDKDAEDSGLGFYDGKEFSPGEIVEEQLMLNLPYVVSCSVGSLESCNKALESLKYLGPDEDKDGPTKDNPFAIFKGMKIN